MTNISTNYPIKICFVALGAYPLLKKQSYNRIVGPDVNQSIIVEALKKYKFEISVITYGEGDSVENFNDLKFIKIPPGTHPIRVLDIAIKVLRVWMGIWMTKADIYFNAGGSPGVTSIFCRLMGKKYVYSIASDALVDRNVVGNDISGFSRSIFNIGNFGNWLDIRLANVIIVQSEYQKTTLKKNFFREGTLIKMPFPITKGEIQEKARPPIALWVGSLAEVKQPELFVKLAEAIPQARFQMIGGHSFSQEFLYDSIKNAARRIPNFEYFGVVPFEEIDEYFSRASILVNTSIFEGFPNAFVQAWNHRIPVVSLNANPDELICNYNMGLHSKTFDQMVEDVAMLIRDRQLREEMGMNGREYVEKNHDIVDIIGQYIDIFNRIMIK